MANEADAQVAAPDVRLRPASTRATLQRNLGDEIGIDAFGRNHVSRYLGAFAAYGFSRRGSDVDVPPAASSTIGFTSPVRSAQTVAVGITYSTVDAFQRGKFWAPMEFGFLHRQTIIGAGGAPRVLSDAVELRGLRGGSRRAVYFVRQ